jgi:two-component system cell cycle response regulator CpdR
MRYGLSSEPVEFMARLSSVAQTERTGRPLAIAVRKLAVAGRSCGACGSTEIRPSNRRNALDILLACALLAPFRCRICRTRFYLFWRPSLKPVPDPPVAPLLMMPAPRKVPKNEAIPVRRLTLESVPPTRQPPELISVRLKPDAAAWAPIESSPAGPEVPDGRLDEVGASASSPPVEVPDLSTPPAPIPDVLAVSGPALTDAPAPPAAGPSGTILILESDLSIRKLLYRLLDRRGYAIAEIDQAAELPGQLRDRPADLLIVDYSPAREDNVELGTLARAHPRSKILALSEEPLAFTEPDNELLSRLMVLPKPFALDSFVDCVERLLGRLTDQA